MSSHGTASIGSWVEFASSVFRQLPRPEEMVVVESVAAGGRAEALCPVAVRGTVKKA